jgi:hypothetical protein
MCLPDLTSDGPHCPLQCGIQTLDGASWIEAIYSVTFSEAWASWNIVA